MSVLGLYVIIFGIVFLIYNSIRDKMYERASNKRNAAIKAFTNKWCDQELEARLLTYVEDRSKYDDIYRKIEEYKNNDGAMCLYSLDLFKDNQRLSPWYHVGKYRLPYNKKNIPIIKGLLLETYNKIPYMDAFHMCSPGYVKWNAPKYTNAPTDDTIMLWVDTPPWSKYE